MIGTISAYGALDAALNDLVRMKRWFGRPGGGVRSLHFFLCVVIARSEAIS